jgi:hypothetical protein
MFGTEAEGGVGCDNKGRRAKRAGTESKLQARAILSKSTHGQ